jgi:hypothetical protein
MYSYDDEKEINQNEKPIKANDHALDALRYVISMIQIEKPSEVRRRVIELDAIRKERGVDFEV